jgi:hypothetical protein
MRTSTPSSEPAKKSPKDGKNPACAGWPVCYATSAKQRPQSGAESPGEGKEAKCIR